MKDIRYFEPMTIEDTCRTIARYGQKARLLAGGTDLLIQMRKKAPDFNCLVNLKRITELASLGYDRNVLKIGALVTHKQLIDADIPDAFLLLKEACLAVASVQIQNLGTLVGNICNASPSADTSPSLIALRAGVNIVSLDGKRKILVEDFFEAPFKTVLKPNEMVTGIDVALPASKDCGLRGGSYLWLPKVTETDETLVGAAVFIDLEDSGQSIKEVRIALGSVAPVPMRARKAEAFLTGREAVPSIFAEAGGIAAGETSPRSRAEYRRELVKALVERSLGAAVERARRGGKAS